MVLISEKTDQIETVTIQKISAPKTNMPKECIRVSMSSCWSLMSYYSARLGINTTLIFGLSGSSLCPKSYANPLPFSFFQPPNDPYGIQREDLILSLRAVLASTPRFAEVSLTTVRAST